VKKIIQWLSGGVIKEIGGVIDKLTTTEEEKLEIKKQVQQILEEKQILKLKSRLQQDGSQICNLILLCQKIFAQWFLYT
jgi:hypothetical protein